MSKKWWSKGIRFECQQSGKCCVSHGEYGYVYLTKGDRKKIAKLLGLSTLQFTRTYCDKTGGYFHLKENGPECLFLQNKKCNIYQARPTQCKTWPFWPDTLPAKNWNREVKTFCPGVGKGKLWSEKEINRSLQEQQKWEDDLDKN